jgi:hypothetical protein
MCKVAYPTEFISRLQGASLGSCASNSPPRFWGWKREVQGGQQCCCSRTVGVQLGHRDPKHGRQTEGYRGLQDRGYQG